MALTGVILWACVIGQDYWDTTKGTVWLRQDESRFVLKESNRGWRGSLPCGLMFYESNNDFLKFISLVMDVYCEKWFWLEKSDIYHLGHRVKDLMIDGILGLQWIYYIYQFWFPHRLRLRVCWCLHSLFFCWFMSLQSFLLKWNWVTHDILVVTLVIAIDIILQTLIGQSQILELFLSF